jgi:tRNA U34 5-methylaminomethyl-2-thiouridine-forming methyltransferase MnmC
LTPSWLKKENKCCVKKDEFLGNPTYFWAVERKIIETGDGSKTIQLVDWEEQYHSVHGALQEARHVFIKHFEEALVGRKDLKIFEMGMGTGLNAYLTCQCATENNLKVQYFTLEAYPIKEVELKELDYENLLGDKAGTFENLHSAVWGETTEISEHFKISKEQSKIEEWANPKEEFDFVFYDAFGPRHQPHLWTVPIFQKIFELLKPGGMFITYCAKGQVRRDLESVGFEMHRVPGPPGKREMLVGKKC